MRSATRILIIILSLILFSCGSTSQIKDIKKPVPEFDFSDMEKNIFPESIGIVNDYDKIFTEKQRNELSKILYDYEVKTTNQIVVITIDNIKPYDDIQRYASGLGNAWGVGTAEKDNGLVIVVCNPCRQIGISTGYGTELILTDEICKDVIENTIIPEIKNGEIYKGIYNGVTELMKKWI